MEIALALPDPERGRRRSRTSAPAAAPSPPPWRASAPPGGSSPPTARRRPWRSPGRTSGRWGSPMCRRCAATGWHPWPPDALDLILDQPALYRRGRPPPGPGRPAVRAPHRPGRGAATGSTPFAPSRPRRLRCLRPGGLLAIEHGCDQGAPVRELFAARGPARRDDPAGPGRPGPGHAGVGARGNRR